MRLRYRTVLYQIDDGVGLRHHYQDLIDEFLRQAQAAHTITRRSVAWRPPMDIHESRDAYIIKVELAGMSEEDIEVTLYADAVVVSGTRENELFQEEGLSFHEAQIRYGQFQAAAPLPSPIDRDCAEARYDNGFLYLRLPKRAPDRLPVKPGRAIEEPPVAADDSRIDAPAGTEAPPSEGDDA